MEISQLIDAEWSYREGASCRQNAILMLINRAETFSSFSFQLLKVLKALAVGRGRQELLNYLRTGGIFKENCSMRILRLSKGLMGGHLAK